RLSRRTDFVDCLQIIHTAPLTSPVGSNRCWLVRDAERRGRHSNAERGNEGALPPPSRGAPKSWRIPAGPTAGGAGEPASRPLTEARTGTDSPRPGTPPSDV